MAPLTGLDFFLFLVGWLAADFEADVADGLLVGDGVWLVGDGGWLADRGF
jgi:hypothetical protein